MIHLDLYGKTSSRYEYLKKILTERLTESEIDVSLREHHDVKDFMEENVTSIPAIRINKDRLFECKDDKNIEAFANEVLKAIFEKRSEIKQEIIVPIDFSETSINALKFASNLANAVDADIRLVHAFHPQPVQVNGALWINPETASTFTKNLNNLTNSLAQEFPKVGFHIEVLEGFASDVITSMSSHLEAKFIVMGSSGESSSLRKWMGRVSREVALKSKCPTFVIPPNFDFNIKNMLYACDIKHPDLHALEIVERVASALHVELYIVRVNVPGEKASLPPVVGPLGEALSRHKVIHIESSEIVEGLLSSADELDCNLLALATRQRSFWDQFLHKSTTKAVYNQLENRSLLVLHR